MARRMIEVAGEVWEVYPSGRVTVYGRDQLGIAFLQGTGPERRRRYTRFNPIGAQSPDAAIAALTDRQLTEFFHSSQPAWTAPEASYGAR
ncbi:MAG TPA: hypothetical protein VN848_07155 [Gemmatimonadales bacterium]|nr:hypothetical protein [Gemmatimonadales bacterium]